MGSSTSTNGIDVGNLAVLGVASIVLTVVATVGISRRDLRE